MDVIQWLCNDGKPPKSAVCQGMNTIHTHGDVPDTFSAVFEYPKFYSDVDTVLCELVRRQLEDHDSGQEGDDGVG